MSKDIAKAFRAEADMCSLSVGSSSPVRGRVKGSVSVLPGRGYFEKECIFGGETDGGDVS